MKYFALGIEKITTYNIPEFLGKGEVVFHSFVNDGMLDLPGAEDIVKAQSPKDKRKAVLAVSKDVASHWNSIIVTGIEDGHTFEFGDTGKVLYENKTSIPLSIDWFMVALESDQKTRDIGSGLDEFFTDDRVDKVASAINVLATGASALNPAAAAGIVIGKFLFKGITTLMKKNKDDLIAVIYQSFIRPKDYPQGTRYGVGVQDLRANAWYDYFIYGIDERD